MTGLKNRFFLHFYNAWSLDIKNMSLKYYVEIRNGTIVNM